MAFPTHGYRVQYYWCKNYTVAQALARVVVMLILIILMVFDKASLLACSDIHNIIAVILHFYLGFYDIT